MFKLINGIRVKFENEKKKLEEGEWDAMIEVDLCHVQSHGFPQLEKHQTCFLLTQTKERKKERN